jgi:uncharacterized heparinase superfamily protein
MGSGVTEDTGLAARRTAFLHRLHARLAGWTPPATGFATAPEPRTIGRAVRGEHLIAGRFLFAGTLIEAPGVSPFAVEAPDPAFAAEAQGFLWLDDLAAVGDAAAQDRAQAWTRDWMVRFGQGQGPGWTPEVTGRRLIRWINHAALVQEGPDDRLFLRALTRQVVFLQRRWKAAPPGLPRFEALAGLICAALTLQGQAGRIAPAVQALAQDCAGLISRDGGIPSRNPEELLEIFALLVWTAQALAEAGQRAPADHLAAIERIAPTLRSLRHADGGLARFHGGGRGLEGRLDGALAASGTRAVAAAGLVMGYARLSGGRTSVIVDAASPPDGAAAVTAHASTLAFEVTSGRRPLIVSCGSGVSFGADWRRAGRATASHSTLAVEGFSSSRFGTRGGSGGETSAAGREALTERAKVTQAWLTEGAGVQSLATAHEGWARTHGLTHARQLHLAIDGRTLRGEDILGAFTPAETRRFEQVQLRSGGIRFVLRFHLHPDVEALPDPDGTAVALTLKSGEVWMLRHDGAADLTMEPSVYLEKGRLAPRPARQVVLSARMPAAAVQIDWTLAKTQDTPLAIRDVDPDGTPDGAEP